MVKQRQPLKRGAVEGVEDLTKCSKRLRNRRNEGVEREVSSPVSSSTSSSRPNGDSETEILLSPHHPRRTPLGCRSGRDSQPFGDGNTPYKGALGRDDLLLSQTSDCVSEVGWDNRSPGTLRQLQRALRNGDTSVGTDGIADIVKKLADEEQGFPTCSPQLVDLWMQKQDEGKQGEARSELPFACLPRGGRQKRGQPSAIKNAVMSKELLQKLASVIQAREGNEESVVTPLNMRSPRVSPKPEHNNPQDGTRKNSDPGPAVDESLELFDTDEDFMGLLPGAGDIQKDSDGAKTTVPSEFMNKRSESADDSCENLWDDDDDDSFLLKATQELVAETQSFPDIICKNTKSQSSMPGASVRKTGRYTFSLHHDNQTSRTVCARLGSEQNNSAQSGIVGCKGKNSSDACPQMPFKNYCQEPNAGKTQIQKTLTRNKSEKQKLGSDRVAQTVPSCLQAGSDKMQKLGTESAFSCSSVQSQQTVKQSRCASIRNTGKQCSSSGSTNTRHSSHAASGPAHTLKSKQSYKNMDNKKQPVHSQVRPDASNVSADPVNRKTLQGGDQNTKCTTNKTKKLTTEAGNISISEDLLAALAEPDEILDSQISVGSTDSEEFKPVVCDSPVRTTCKSDVNKLRAPICKTGSCQVKEVVTLGSKCATPNPQNSTAATKEVQGEKILPSTLTKSHIKGTHKAGTEVGPCAESFLSDDDLLAEDQLLDFLNQVESQATYKTCPRATTADTYPCASRLGGVKEETASSHITHKAATEACLSVSTNQQARSSTCQSASYTNKPPGQVQHNKLSVDTEQTRVLCCSQELCGSPTKYSPEEIERKKQEALKRRQTHQISSSQQKLSFSPTKYSAEETERKKQEALRKRQVYKLSSSQEKQYSSPMKCLQEIECKKQEGLHKSRVLKFHSSQEKVPSSPSKYTNQTVYCEYQESLNRGKTQDLRNSQDTFSCSPKKYSTEEIKRKRQEALQKRQTHILQSSQEKSSSSTKHCKDIKPGKLGTVQQKLYKRSSSQEEMSSSPTNYSVQETEYKKQDVFDKQETEPSCSSQDIFACSPPKCSQEQIEQKKQEALRRREACKLKNSQDRLACSPTKNSVAEVLHEKQEVPQRHQTVELQSSQDKVSLSPTKYSLEEIQRKKQEALKRRQNRLRLHPKVKTEQKRHS